MIAFFLPILFLGGIVVVMKANEEDKIDCKEYIHHGVIEANCSGQKKLMNIPNNLNPNIQVLNLSGNLLYQVSGSSFDAYKESLVMLDMSYSKNQYLQYEEDSFVSLSKLEYLDLSDTCFPRSDKLMFPRNIKVLKLNFCKILGGIKLDLTQLEKLEEFFAKESNLMELPKFNKLTPLKYLDLEGNILLLLNATEFAPFCLLSEINLVIEHRTGLQQEKRYCECVKTRRWLTYTKVHVNKLNCTRFSWAPRCEFNDVLDDDSLDLRQECLQRYEISTTVFERSWWVTLVTVSLFLLGITIPVSFLIRRKLEKIRRKKDEIISEEVDQENESIDEDAGES